MVYITTHQASSSSLLQLFVAISTSVLRQGLGATLLVLVTSDVAASMSLVSRPGSSCSPPPPRSLMLQASAGSCMAGDVALSTWLGFRGRGGRYVAGHGGEAGHVLADRGDELVVLRTRVGQLLEAVVEPGAGPLRVGLGSVNLTILTRAMVSCSTLASRPSPDTRTPIRCPPRR